MAHWVWGQGGWANPSPAGEPLFGCGVIDFAGSGVVHMTGGMAALVGIFILGPRAGRFNEDGTNNTMPQQSAVLQVRRAYIITCTSLRELLRYHTLYNSAVVVTPNLFCLWHDSICFLACFLILQISVLLCMARVVFRTRDSCDYRGRVERLTGPKPRRMLGCAYTSAYTLYDRLSVQRTQNAHACVVIK